MRTDGRAGTGPAAEARRERDPESAPDPPEEILNDPNLLDRASALMDELGLEGEQLNRKLVFLAGVGGLLGEPIHLIIKGESSGGKNTLANTALRLLPEESVLATSGLTPQALAYYEEETEDGRRRGIEGVLLFDEAEGFKGAEYPVRQAMSEGRVARLTVGKDESGRMTTKKRVAPVTASVITTTTATALHPENQTRVFDVWIDESEEQTRRVVLAQAKRAAGGVRRDDVEARLERWRAALNQLEPLDAVVPYAVELARAFPATQSRMRRDHERLISLLNVSALLHQEQRRRDSNGRVIASLVDYELIYPLLQKVVKPSIQGLNDTALLLSMLLDEMEGENERSWIRRTDLEKEAARQDVARSSTTVRKWARRLTDLGYWEGRQVGPHEAWEYRPVRDPFEEPLALPRPEEIAEEPGAEEEREGSFAVDAQAGAGVEGGASEEEVISIEDVPGYTAGEVATG